MNQESSGGPDRFVSLQFLLRSVLSMSKKELFKMMNEDRPPLIHKKLLMNTLYELQIRIARLFIVYKWNLNKERVLLKDAPSRLHFLYYRNLFIKLQEIGKSLQIYINPIPNLIKIPEIKTIENQPSPDKFNAKQFIYLPRHKSITNVQIFKDKARFFSKNKFNFEFSFKSKLRLTSFNINCHHRHLTPNFVESIAGNLIQLFSKSENPVFQCSAFLESIYVTLLFAEVCKSFIKYQSDHKFTIHSTPLSIQLNFYELNTSFTLDKCKSSIFLYSNDFINSKIRFQINSISEVPDVLNAIQRKASFAMFTNFKKQIEDWIPTTTIYTTSINEKYRVFTFLLCDIPIANISFTSENTLTTNSPEFLNALQYHDRSSFNDFIETAEYQLIAILTGFSRSILYNDRNFEIAMLKYIDSPIFSEHMPSFISSKFLRKVYSGDKNQIDQFRRAIFATNRNIFYTDLRNLLLQDRINSFLNETKLIYNLETYHIVIFKITENGFWQLKFTQQKILLKVNMAIQFQGSHTNLRFGGWIHVLSHSISSIESMIDQIFNQFRHKTISAFHVLQKTGLYFKTAPVMGLKNQSTLPTPIFLHLNPISFIGHDKDIDAFELHTSMPVVRMHFVNNLVLDDPVRRAFGDHRSDLIGQFLLYFIEIFPQILESFKDPGWSVSNINIDGSFTLIVQKKYSVFFKQIGKTEFDAVVPLSGKSIILSIPLSVFPIETNLRDFNSQFRQMITRVSLSEFSQFKSYIMSFFADQKFLQSYGFTHLLFDAKNMIIKSGQNVTNQGWIKMSVSLGPNGLDFEILNEQSNRALYPFKQFLMMRYRNRENRLKVLTFLFNCILIKKPTAFGLFSSLQILLDDDEIRVDWETSFISSTVDIQNCLIILKLFINNNEYSIKFDSKDEKDDSEDANITLINPNGDITSGKRLRNDLRALLQDLIKQEAADHQLYEFSFL